MSEVVKFRPYGEVDVLREVITVDEQTLDRLNRCGCGSCLRRIPVVQRGLAENRLRLVDFEARERLGL